MSAMESAVKKQSGGDDRVRKLESEFAKMQRQLAGLRDGVASKPRVPVAVNSKHRSVPCRNGRDCRALASNNGCKFHHTRSDIPCKFRDKCTKDGCGYRHLSDHARDQSGGADDG